MGRRAARYREVAESLRDAIVGGQLSIGEQLPGELALMERYDVSRHTVREALRILDQLGLVSRRPGIGTVVESRESHGAYVQTIRTAAELLQYPDETVLTAQSSETVQVDRKAARLIGCKPGTEWFRIKGMRRQRESGTPICATLIYVLPEYESVVSSIGQSHRPVYGLIEDQFDERVEEVFIDLRAELIDTEKAAQLAVEVGSPAMSVVRRYQGRRRDLFEVSITTHPADRFSYSLHLAHEWLPELANRAT